MYYVCIWLKNYCIKKPYAYDANMRIYAITSRFHGFPPQKKQKWSELKGVMLWLVEVGPPKSPKLVVPTSICLEILWTGLGRKPIQNPRNKWCVDKFAYAICTTQPNHSPKSTDSNLFPSLSISFPFPAVSCPQIKLILPSPPSDTSRTKILANDLPDQSSWGLFSVTQWQRLFVGFCLKTHTVLFQHDFFPMIGGWSLIFQQQTTRYEIGNPAVFAADIRGESPQKNPPDELWMGGL